MRKFKDIAGIEITIDEISSVTLEDGTIKEYTNPVEARERFNNEGTRARSKSINAAIAEAGFNIYTGERVKNE